MKKIICALLITVLLSGCTLTTIRPPKKGTKKPAKPAVTRPRPAPRPVAVKEKEEILPLEKEEILPLSKEEVK